jgi:hypothetical protein
LVVGVVPSLISYQINKRIKVLEQKIKDLDEHIMELGSAQKSWLRCKPVATPQKKVHNQHTCVN